MSESNKKVGLMQIVKTCIVNNQLWKNPPLRFQEHKYGGHEKEQNKTLEALVEMNIFDLA